MRRAALLLLFASMATDAVVIRHDVPDHQYRMEASEFPALADLPGEGHGVLIAPRWVLTAAHAVAWQPAIDRVVVGGIARTVRRVVVHPGYRQPPQAMVDAALASGDWAAFFAFLEATDDIALIELAEPVDDVAPVPVHDGPILGRTVRLVGRGATGTGAVGHPLHASHRVDLRQGYNTIDASAGRWLGYTFDRPPQALPLEAVSGSGDSGGPILVAVGDAWHVAGIAAWKRSQVVGTEVRPGRYGETAHGVRLAHYADWIARTLAPDAAAAMTP